MKVWIVSLLLVLALVQDTWSCKGLRRSEDDAQVSAGSLACCVCGQSISVNLIVRNMYQEPYFERQIEVKDKPQRELLHHLEQAANMNDAFKFTAKYFGSMGYMITTINGLSAFTDDKTYWELLEHPTGNSLSLGVSSYVPMDGETVVFNFTTWAVSDHS